MERGIPTDPLTAIRSPDDHLNWPGIGDDEMNPDNVCFH